MTIAAAIDLCDELYRVPHRSCTTYRANVIDPFDIRKHHTKIMMSSGRVATETLSHAHWSLEELSLTGDTYSTGSC